MNDDLKMPQGIAQGIHDIGRQPPKISPDIPSKNRISANLQPKVANVQAYLLEKNRQPDGAFFARPNINPETINRNIIEFESGKIADEIKQEKKPEIAASKISFPPEILPISNIFAKIENLFVEHEGVFKSAKDIPAEAAIDPRKTVAIHQGKVYGLEVAVKSFIEKPAKVIDEVGKEIKEFVVHIISEEDFEPIAKIITTTITNYRVSVAQNKAKMKSQEKGSVGVPDFSGQKLEKSGTYPRPMEPVLIKDTLQKLVQKIIIANIFIREARAEAKKREEAKKQEKIDEAMIAKDILKHEVIEEGIQKEIIEKPLES